VTERENLRRRKKPIFGPKTTAEYDNVYSTEFTTMGRQIDLKEEPEQNSPDLILVIEDLIDTIYIESTTIGEVECASLEGCLGPGAAMKPRHTAVDLLRFAVTSLNNGTADYRPSLEPSKWQFFTCHDHYHSEPTYSEYTILPAGGSDIVAAGHKASFCLEDVTCTPRGKLTFKCGTGRNSNNVPQGISVGCGDTYGAHLDCQWIDITEVADGPYTLRVTVNPNKLRMESDWTNNRGECRMTLGRAANGKRSVKLSDCKHVPI